MFFFEFVFYNLSVSVYINVIKLQNNVINLYYSIIYLATACIKFQVFYSNIIDSTLTIKAIDSSNDIKVKYDSFVVFCSLISTYCEQVKLN